MQRSVFTAVTAAVFATFAVGADHQSSTPQAPQPVATASAAANLPPAITLSTAASKQVFGTGERVLVMASATDDADAPERLQYQWTLKSLDSGVEKPARSTALRQVQASLHTPGKYEFKCVVTDTAAASSEATLVVAIEDAGDPEISAATFDEATAAIHHTTSLWQAGVPAIRRGDWARLIVSVRNFIAGAHLLKVFVDGKMIGTDGAASGWAVQNLGGTVTERHLRVFVPPDVAVGKHTIEVAAIRRGTDGAGDTETGRTSVKPEPLILFNPWRSAVPDVSVNAGKPLSHELATFYTTGTQDLVMTGLASESVYDVTPHDKSVIRLAQEIVASMPPDARGDAGKVAAAMAAYVGDRVLLGKWPAKDAADPYPGATKRPWEWRGAPEVCEQYLKTTQKVSYGQCWVFGFTLTGLLRSIGIPAREITVTGAGRDIEQEWGVLQTKYECRRWSGPRCDDSHTASAQEQLNFHTWNEVWIPSLNAAASNPEHADGWAAADATPQVRAGAPDAYVGTPSLKSVREFSPPPRGQQLPGADDAALLYEATNLPWEISWKGQDNTWFKAAGPGATASHGFVATPRLERSDELRNYRATPAVPKSVWRLPLDLLDGALKRMIVPVAAQQVPALQISTGPVVNVRASANVRVTGSGAAPGRLGLAVIHLPRELNGGTLETPVPGGLVFATVVEPRSSGGSWSAALEIPGDVLDAAGAYDIAVGPPQGVTGPSGRARLDVRGLPIAVALPSRVTPGTTFAISARLMNSTNAPVSAAQLRLVLPSQLRFVGGSDTVEQASVPAAGSLRLDATVQAVEPGTFLVGAASESSAGPTEGHTPLTVSRSGRVVVAGVPALSVTLGAPITITADVVHDAVDTAAAAEAELGPVPGPGVSLLSEARKANDSLAPVDRWTPSWQVQVNTPGIYRLPVRAGVAGVGEARSEILLVTGADDPDADAPGDFEEDGTLGYRSLKAMGGAAALAIALVGGAVLWMRRRRAARA